MTGLWIGLGALVVVLVLVPTVIVVLRRGQRPPRPEAVPSAADGPAPAAARPDASAGGNGAAVPGPDAAVPGPDAGPEGTVRNLRPAGGPMTGPVPAVVRGVLPHDLAAAEGGLVLLQLSSAFCTSCRDTRAVLADVASETPGVAHRDLDVALRPELVRLLDVRRTPTTLIVDPRGTELWRAVGVPRRADLSAALDRHRPDGPSADVRRSS